jgi:hypothetical protein
MKTNNFHKILIIIIIIIIRITPRMIVIKIRKLIMTPLHRKILKKNIQDQKINIKILFKMIKKIKKVNKLNKLILILNKNNN